MIALVLGPIGPAVDPDPVKLAILELIKIGNKYTRYDLFVICYSSGYRIWQPDIRPKIIGGFLKKQKPEKR